MNKGLDNARRACGMQLFFATQDGSKFMKTIECGNVVAIY